MLPRRCVVILVFAATLLLVSTSARATENPREALWDAVRNGDVAAIAALLDKGADVNAKNEIGVSALWIAASKGKLPVVELLVRRGADVNSRDGIWYQTPLSTAVGGGNAKLVLRCPAWKKYGTAKTVKANTVILHSRADDVIPFADSEELVKSSGPPATALIEVGTDHRLAEPEPPEAMLRECEGTESLQHERHSTKYDGRRK